MKPPERGHLRLVRSADDAGERFGHPVTARASSPCCALLIGAAGDARGYALHVATGEVAKVSLAPRPDRRVLARYRGAFARDSVAFELGGERRSVGPARLVPQMTKLLEAMGIRLGGFEVALECDAHVGSAEAALGVALLRALRDAFRLALPDGCLGLVAHHASVCGSGAPLDPAEAAAAAAAMPRSFVLTGRGVGDWPCVAVPGDVEVAALSSGPVGKRPAPRRAPRRGHAHDLDAPEALGFLSESLRAVHALEELERSRPRRLGALLEAADREAQEGSRAASSSTAALLATLARQDPDVYAARISPRDGAVVLILARRSCVRQACARVAREFLRQTSVLPAVLLPRGTVDVGAPRTRLVPV